jgi:hypothetical protein
MSKFKKKNHWVVGCYISVYFDPHSPPLNLLLWQTQTLPYIKFFIITVHALQKNKEEQQLTQILLKYFQ